MDNEKAARLGKGLFFACTASCMAVMFLYLTPKTLAYIDKSNHIADKPVPEDVARGKVAFQKYGCMDCHTILGDGTQYAPELGRIAILRDDAFLKSYIRDPHAANPNSGMPTFHAMTAEEASDLVAFLNFTSKVNLPEGLWAEMKAKHDPYDKRAYSADTNPDFYRSYWPPRPISADKVASAGVSDVGTGDPQVTEGSKLFHDNTVASCQTCHSIGGEGGQIGPALTDIGSPTRKSRFGTAVSEEFLETKLVDPAADNPAKQSVMPSYKALSEKQRKALVAFLLSHK